MRPASARLTAALLILGGVVVPPASHADFSSWAQGEGISLATQIASDPGSLLYDLHLTYEDRDPLPVGKIVQVHTTLFPGIFLLGELGGAAKVQLRREHGDWPQIDLFGGGWTSAITMIAGKSASNNSSSSNNSIDPNAKLYGYHFGVTAAESVDPRLRLFASIEGSWMTVSAKINHSGAPSSTSTYNPLDSIDEIAVGKSDGFLWVGSELLRTERKRFVTEIGYGFWGKKLAARMTWSSRNFDTGLAFYPESAIVVWPVANFQVRF